MPTHGDCQLLASGQSVRHSDHQLFSAAGTVTNSDARFITASATHGYDQSLAVVCTCLLIMVQSSANSTVKESSLGVCQNPSKIFDVIFREIHKLTDIRILMPQAFDFSRCQKKSDQ